jgi:hypothetical protein
LPVLDRAERSSNGVVLTLVGAVSGFVAMGMGFTQHKRTYRTIFGVAVLCAFLWCFWMFYWLGGM